MKRFTEICQAPSKSTIYILAIIVTLVPSGYVLISESFLNFTFLFISPHHDILGLMA